MACKLQLLMAGVMLILMSIAKLGTVIRFIPTPVIMGFTAGIGVTIWVANGHTSLDSLSYRIYLISMKNYGL